MIQFIEFSSINTLLSEAKIIKLQERLQECEQSCNMKYGESDILAENSSSEFIAESIIAGKEEPLFESSMTTFSLSDEEIYELL